MKTLLRNIAIQIPFIILAFFILYPKLGLTLFNWVISCLFGLLVSLIIDRKQN